MGKVTIIPSRVNVVEKKHTEVVAKRKVAGYARVSTDSDEQFTSFKAQTEYYEKFIKSKPDEWEFVEVYTDEGISGTNTKHRAGFNRMLNDAFSGKIDLIVTKSISRFARNTVDSLTAIRELKKHKVEVFFEKENIWTFDGKGELLVTIMSSLAQEESRSISENVTWGIRKAFSDGRYSLPYGNLIGYEKGPDGSPVIVEEEAKIIRNIYCMYLLGKTPNGICKALEDEGIPAPRGGNKWSKTTIDSILRNEKYKGDALLQKVFTVDFLQHKQKKNEGEVPQYYVENSHPAIIDPDLWDTVQVEIERREQMGAAYSSKSIFSSKLICEDCGGFYGQKVWHSTDKYRRVLWQCNNKFTVEHKCQTPNVNEEDIKRMFLKAYNLFISKKMDVIEDCELMRKVLTDTKELDDAIAQQQTKVDILTKMVEELVAENASTPQDQEEYLKKYSNLESEYNSEYAKLENLNQTKEKKLHQDKAMQIFIRNLKKSKPLSEWDELVWALMVESGTVHKDGSITFKFHSGSQIEVKP